MGCLESGMVFGNDYRFHVQEVIPAKSRAYRAVDVKKKGPRKGKRESTFIIALARSRALSGPAPRAKGRFQT